jgi:hypothetical protein
MYRWLAPLRFTQQAFTGVCMAALEIRKGFSAVTYTNCPLAITVPKMKKATINFMRAKLSALFYDLKPLISA